MRKRKLVCYERTEEGARAFCEWVRRNIKNGRVLRRLLVLEKVFVCWVMRGEKCVFDGRGQGCLSWKRSAEMIA